MTWTKQKQNALLLGLKNQCWPSTDLQIEDKKSNLEKNECNQAGSSWIKSDQIGIKMYFVSLQR